MAKPIYPFQPFIDVMITDNSDIFSDRIFIPEELISGVVIPNDFFFDSLYELTLKLGYPLSKEDVSFAFGLPIIVEKSKTTTIVTKSENIGSVTISYMVTGMENANPPSLADDKYLPSKGVAENEFLPDIEDDDEYTEVTVSSYINEIVKLNRHHDKKSALKSKIIVMIAPCSNDKMTESKHEWMHYHINNYMNRGYKIYVENESEVGKELIQYIVNCNYKNCVVVLKGEPSTREGLLNYQPIEACAHEDSSTPTLVSVMEQFASFVLDPSKDTVKQRNALANV